MNPPESEGVLLSSRLSQESKDFQVLSPSITLSSETKTMSPPKSFKVSKTRQSKPTKLSHPQGGFAESGTGLITASTREQGSGRGSSAAIAEAFLNKSATTGSLHARMGSGRRIVRDNSVTFSSTIDMVWDSMSRSSKSFKRLPPKDLGRRGKTVISAIVGVGLLFCITAVTVGAALGVLGVWTYHHEYSESVQQIGAAKVQNTAFAAITFAPSRYLDVSTARLPFQPARYIQDESVLRSRLGFETDGEVLLVEFLICRATGAGGNAGMYGMKTLVCAQEGPFRAGEVMSYPCEQNCMIPRGRSVPASFETDFELVEKIAIFSEHGFGTIEDIDTDVVLSVQNNRTESITIDSHRKVVHDTSDSLVTKSLNALVCLLILRTVVVRLAVIVSISRGLMVRNYRIFFASDVAGSVLTSPWGTIRVSYFYVFCAPILYTTGSLDSHQRSLFQLSSLCAAVASVVVLILRYVVSIFWRQFRVSGTLIYLMSVIAVMGADYSHAGNLNLNVAGSATTFFNHATCSMDFHFSNGTVADSTPFNCYQYYQRLRVAGVELMMTLYLGHVLVTLGLVLGMEAVLFVNAKILSRKLSIRVHPLPGFGESWFSVSEQDYQASSCEAVSMLSASGRSRFNSTMTSSIDTVFGNFFHLGTMIENDLVRWGPLILAPGKYLRALVLSVLLGKKRAVHLLIATQSYAGVQVSEHAFRAKRENQLQLPEFLRNYNYDEISWLPDRRCVL